MKRAIYPLYDPADESRAQPILDALKQRGVRVREAAAKAGKRDALLLFLSKNVSANDPVIDEFFHLCAGRDLVIPVNLDGCTPPEVLANALMARHALDGRKYGPAELADRIAAPLPIRRRVAPILAVTGAAILLAAALILLFPRREGPPPDPGYGSPTVQTTVAPLPTPNMPFSGIDPATIVEVVFVGDEYAFYTAPEGSSPAEAADMQGWTSFAYGGWVDDDIHFYSKADGHEYPHEVAVDTSWLAMLPNLQYLSLCDVSTELPDLSGLAHLTWVHLGYCRVPDLEWLRGSAIEGIEYHGGSVEDFSPLTDCPALISAHLDMVNSTRVDLSSFHPSKLTSLGLGSGIGAEGLEFSCLLQCPGLKELYFSFLPQLRDLSCLKNAARLETLHIENCSEIRSFSGLEEAGRLQWLEVDNCPSLQDISALAACAELRTLWLQGEPMRGLRDVSALGKLPRLENIQLRAANLQDLDFLRELPTKTSLGFSCDLGSFDCSGLEAIESFTDLSLSCYDRSFSTVAPYLTGKTVHNLELYGATDLDLAALPRVTETLNLIRCDIRDLTGIGGKDLTRLGLYDCQYLSSLEGIDELLAHGRRLNALTVEGCPRLRDWSALQGKRLQELTLRGVWSLPDMSDVTAMILQLENIEPEVLPDLSCLDALDDDQGHSFRLADLYQITSLQPLFRLHGDYLEVPPQLEDQAAELVESGRFHRYEIAYPDGSWQPDDSDVTLLSLDELTTLPKSVLKRVRSLTLAGDTLVDSKVTELSEEWTEAGPVLKLRDRATGTETVVTETGALLTDFSPLSALTGLERLSLYYVPLTDLDGIQTLENLRELDVQYSPFLTDASAAFTVQALERACFSHTGLMSIQGVQNLTALQELNIDDTRVSSLEGIEGASQLASLVLGQCDVRDMRLLLELDHLSCVEVSSHMAEAIASLGEGYGFQLIIRDD